MKWECLECENTTLKSLGHKEHLDYNGCNEGTSPTETTVECFICLDCDEEYIELWDDLEFA